MDRVRLAEKPMLRTDLPRPSIGDTVAVSIKVTEGDKQRVQIFTGTVIGIRGGGLGETFTVRRLVSGEGVERIFPLHSPVIAGIEIQSKGRVRRAKLHYLRDRKGKSTRLTAILGEQGEAGAEARNATVGGASARPAKESAKEPAATEGGSPKA
jgi:large subunit ribosomal protein L19